MELPEGLYDCIKCDKTIDYTTSCPDCFTYYCVKCNCEQYRITYLHKHNKIPVMVNGHDPVCLTQKGFTILPKWDVVSVKKHKSNSCK